MAIALGCSWFDDLAGYPDIVESLDYIEVAGWQLGADFERPHPRLVLHNLDQDWSMAAIDAIGLDWRLTESEIDALKAVTPEQVRAVAQRYLVDDNLTVATLKPLPMDQKQARAATVEGGRHGS